MLGLLLVRCIFDLWHAKTKIDLLIVSINVRCYNYIKVIYIDAAVIYNRKL